LAQTCLRRRALDELRKKVQNHLNADRLNSRQANPGKGLDLDDPEARRRFIQNEL
jgi:hypothetical protein